MNKLMVSLALLGFTGCASAVQLPRAQIDNLEASMRGAKEMGALTMSVSKEHHGGFGMSAARAHLELANDQAEVARTMAADGDPRALMLLARAQSEADLALGITRQAAMHSRALAARTR